MLDTNDLLKAFKQAAVEAVRASKPAEVTYGKVVSSDPLVVEVDQKIALGEKQLSRGESMQEYEAELEIEVEELELEIELQVEGKSVPARAEGSGTMKGKVKIRRRLEAGEEVILMRKQGGQNYIIQDKVKNDDT